MTRRRLDAELVRRGLANDRSEAEAAVHAGLVSVGGRPATKTTTLVAPEEPVRVAARPRRFVSRGGEKLRAALDRFRLDPAGLDCLDAGASTGGFTDCLLQADAARVIAVDVGYGQLAWTLRTDPRVVVMDRTNVRELRPDALSFIPTLVVADLSFVSLRSLVPALVSITAPDGALIGLVKPQFEADPRKVLPGGVVRDPEVWRRALTDVTLAFARAGAAVRAVMASPLLGPAGNVEFLLNADMGASFGPEPRPEPDIGSAVVEGLEVAR